jgi:hypothetical protein
VAEEKKVIVAAAPSTTDIDLLAVNSFVIGMQATLFVPNINTCTNATRYAINDLNATFAMMSNTSFSSASIFNLTSVVSGSVAESVF